MHLRKTLESDFKIIPKFIEEALGRINKEFQLTEDEIFDLTLVLEESITNAVKHGNKSAPDLKVEITITSEEERLLIKVKNGGPGFDDKKVPDPTRKDKLMKTSGRGIFLIKKTMDEVSFHDHGREIHMLKALGTKRPHEPS